MDPKQRAQNAVAAGKYKSVEAWCAAVCVSDDPRVPKEMRDWAHKQLTGSLGSRAWVWLLAARRDKGERLHECQAKAVKQLYDQGSATRASEESSSGGEIPE
jgi:hypothetical protein